MSPVKTQKLVGLMAGNLSEAWELARQCIQRAQRKQKECHDRKGRSPNFAAGERVFLFKLAEKTEHAWKFARPYHGPFRIVDLNANTAKIRRVDWPEEEAILVSLERLRRCPLEAPICVLAS